MFQLTKPVIAAINGWAAGGGLEIALACDLIVASRDAHLALPEVKRGLVPDAGGMLRLPKRIPRALAMEMMLTGRPVEAEEAERWGLVNRVVGPADLMDEARELAGQIVAAAPLAVEAVKALVAATEDMSVPNGYAALRAGVIPHYKRSNESEDAKEGPRAFAEGRDPEWKGE
jgi:crotonobetainyl-CoA hydratase